MSSSVSNPAAVIPTRTWRIERDEQAGIVWVQSIGDIAPEPADWRQRMTSALRTLHGVAVVGAKRLAEQGRLFSMGEFVIHPKGFHHMGQGILPHAYRFPEEVDAVAGGLLAVDMQAFDAVLGEQIVQGDLGPLELCLALRKAGRRCVVVPQVVVTDEFTPSPSAQANRDFAQRWGFDWRAADLEAVRARHGASGLVWNARFHAPSMPFDKYEDRPAVHWTNYEKVDVYRQRADHLIKLAKQHCGEGPALDLGCGDGLFVHLLAQQGAAVVGVDPEAVAIEQANQQVAARQYAGDRPRFVLGSGDKLDFSDGTFQLVMMLDVIEHLPNPVKVLGEVSRVLRAGGALVLSTPAWQYAGWSDPFYHACEYAPDELVRQVTVAGGLELANLGRIGGVYRDLVVVARKPGKEQPQMHADGRG